MPNWNHIAREHLTVLRLPPEREIEIVEEQALHLEAAYEDALAAGLSEAEAEARALRSYDWQLLECELSRAERPMAARATQTPLDLIELRGGSRMESFIQDLRYGVRMLLKSPAFTLAAILSLAIGIGANTALFSVVNSVLWRPLPYPGAERLVRVGRRSGADVFAALKQTDRAFDGLAGWRARDFILTGRGGPAHLKGQRVTAELLPLLDVKPQAGRGFVAEEFQPGRNQVAIISNRLWQSRFGADPQLIGQTVTLDLQSYTIIGVTPPRFDFFPTADLLTPLALTEKDIRDPDYGLSIVARLKPGLTLAQAQVELAEIARGLEERRNTLIAQQHRRNESGAAWVRFDEQREWRLQPLRELLVKDFRLTLLAIWGMVGFVLLIACANVANLMLARAANRRKELAIRAAIGARRMRLMRQLLTESALVAGVGGAIGLLCAYLGVQALLAANPAILPRLGATAAVTTIPRLGEVAINGWALTFNLGLTLLTGMLFGLAPALHFSRPDLNHALKEGALISPAGFRFGLRRSGQSLVVVGEVALALALLVGAGLLIRSLRRMQQIEPGFNPDRLLTMQLEFPGSRYHDNAQVMSFVTELNDRLAALPGVESVGVADSLPLTPVGSFSSIGIEGKADLKSKPDEPMYDPISRISGPSAFLSRVSPGYFRTLGIPLLQGRDFGSQDREGSLPVAIINEAMAQRFWPGEDPLGKRVWAGVAGWRMIVGVAPNVKRLALEDQPKPELYMPSLQPRGMENKEAAAKAGAKGGKKSISHTIAIMNPTATQGRASYISLMVRTRVRPEALAEAVRKTVWSLDPDQPILQMGAMQARLDEFYAPRRFNMLLFGVFALIALLLAAAGIYGVLAYTVAQRTHEIGIRIALGAQPRDVLWLIVRQGLALTLIGVALGAAAALALTRVLQNLLYGVSATDPATFAGIALLLVGVAFITSFIPARRATKVDPLTSLRHE